MSEKTLNTGYKQEEVMKKPTRYKLAQMASMIKLTTYVPINTIWIEKKKPWSELVGVKWCDIHKEWYITSLTISTGINTGLLNT